MVYVVLVMNLRAIGPSRALRARACIATSVGRLDTLSTVEARKRRAKRDGRETIGPGVGARTLTLIARERVGALTRASIGARTSTIDVRIASVHHLAAVGSGRALRTRAREAARLRRLDAHAAVEAREGRAEADGRLAIRPSEPARTFALIARARRALEARAAVLTRPRVASVHDLGAIRSLRALRT